MKRFAVIGLGNFGMALARELARLGQKVYAIDANPDKARDAQMHVNQAMVADATELENLVAMGIKKVDAAIVSLGGRMDVATTVVLHLTKLGVPQIVAKALNEDHAEILKRVGATRVIFPEKQAAARAAERLSSRNVLGYLTLSSGFSVVELAPSINIVGKTLEQLDFSRKYGTQVLAVKEIVPERTIIAPGPDRVIKDSDVLVVMGPEEELRKLKET